MEKIKSNHVSKRLLSVLLLSSSFIFLFFFVSSQPPHFDADSNMVIELVDAETHKAGVDYKLHVHVLNLSEPDNGYLTNSTTDCYIHVYDLTTGNHLVKDKMVFDGSFDFEYTIGGGNYTQGRDVKNIVFCNTTQLNDIIVSEMKITSSGFELTVGLYFILLAISLGVAILGFYIKDNWVVVLGGFGMVLLGLFQLFYGIDGFQDNTYTWGLGLILLVLGGYFSIRGSMEQLS